MKLKQDDAKLFKMYYSDEDILQEATITEMPQQMGNRKLLEMTRCLLIDSRLHKMLWGAAILHATTIRNLVVRQGQGEYPAELMRGIKPKLSISKLSIFGCTVLTRKRDRDVSKLEPRYWKETLWVTLKETMDTWCSFPAHARWWQFNIRSSRSTKHAQSLTTQRHPS